MPDFSLLELVLIAVIFVWTDFVRSGIGFGGAALGLPFMLFVYDQPLFWLPIIGSHLLFFSGITLRSRLQHIDWMYLKHASWYIMPAALIGVLGLVQFPTLWLLIFIYSVTLFYAILWLANLAIQSNQTWVDKFLLVVGGYVAGTSLTGAPLMVAVFAKNVEKSQLRNTLFVLWFILVSAKMLAFIALNISLNLDVALILLPIAGLGHFLGLKLHEMILRHDHIFQRAVGGILVLVSVLGLWQLF